MAKQHCKDCYQFQENSYFINIDDNFQFTVFKRLPDWQSPDEGWREKWLKMLTIKIETVICMWIITHTEITSYTFKILPSKCTR